MFRKAWKLAAIPLWRKGKIVAQALVDEEDVALVSRHRWFFNSSGRGYASRKSSGRVVFMHRAILGLTGRALEPDHINGDGLDNRRANLRIVSHAQNLQNKRSYAGSTSKFRGVWWNRLHRKWEAGARHQGKNFHLGYYASEEEAAAAASDWRRRNMPFSMDALNSQVLERELEPMS